MWKKIKNTAKDTGKDSRLFTLDVLILYGDISDEFLKKNKVISRTIEILGDQTLEDLHHCIFEAFDRFDEHLYEFQFGGKGPDDPNAKRYVLPAAKDRTAAGDLTRTKIGSLGLKVGDIFGYVFDYGDNWLHQIDVLSISDSAPAKKYPCITKRVGQSPPQYRDDDEDDEGWEDEEFEDDDAVFAGQEITVTLSEKQRNLLLSIQKKMDGDVASLILDAEKDDDLYEIVLTDDQIDSLLDTVFRVMNKEKDKTRHTELLELSDHLFDAVERGVFGSDEAEQDNGSNIPVIDLTCFSGQSLDIAPKSLDFLHDLVKEIVQLCRISGISIDKYLESQKPIWVAPDEKVDVPLTSQQKERLLTLPSMKADIAAPIKWAHEKKNVKLTLRQINELENIVATAVQQAADKKTKNQLTAIDQSLIAVQIKYTDKDDSASQISPSLSPDQCSRGEIIRNLMTNIMNAYKDIPEGQHSPLNKKKKGKR